MYCNLTGKPHTGNLQICPYFAELSSYKKRYFSPGMTCRLDLMAGSGGELVGDKFTRVYVENAGTGSSHSQPFQAWNWNMPLQQNLGNRNMGNSSIPFQQFIVATCVLFMSERVVQGCNIPLPRSILPSAILTTKEDIELCYFCWPLLRYCGYAFSAGAFYRVQAESANPSKREHQAVSIAAIPASRSITISGNDTRHFNVTL